MGLARTWARARRACARGGKAPRSAAGLFLRTRRRRAFMLLLVLWIAVVLSIMAYSVLYQMSLELRLTSMQKKTMQAKALARAGLARGFVDLRNDMISDFSDKNKPPFDALGDYWTDFSEDKSDVELEPGHYSLTTRDEDGYLNLNVSRASNRILLEKVIERCGYDEKDAKIVASAIIDYADADDTPVLDMAKGGNEGMAYGFQRAEDLGLSTREDDVEKVVLPNEQYFTVDALLEVYGVSPELYFGPGTPEATFYAGKAGVQGKDRFKITRRTMRATRSEKVHGLRDYFTVDGSGKLNINTAPQHVLAAVFDAAGAADPDRLAERIVRFRPGGNGSRRVNNDTAFKSGADMQANGDLAGILGPAQALYPFEVRSTAFTLTSTGYVGDVRSTLRCTVTRNLTQLQRDESFEGNERRREREALYEDRSQRRKDKDNEMLIRVPSIRILEWETGS